MEKIDYAYKQQKMTPIKLYFVKCNNFRKHVNPNISYILIKTLIIFFICSNCDDDNNDIIFKEEENVEIFKTYRLIE